LRQLVPDRHRGSGEHRHDAQRDQKRRHRVTVLTA
jgi:hypothetical protein